MPKAKDSLTKPYFPHDFNARNDEKIVRLRKELGWEGYGLYMAMVEKMHESGGELELDFESIAFDLRCNVEIIENIVKKFEIFRIQGKKITSRRVRKNIASRIIKSEKYRINARVRWGYEKHIKDAIALPPQSDCNAIKESKVKESKVNSNRDFQPPKIEEVKEYCVERKNNVDSKKFHDFYSSKGWMVGRNKMKDWKASVRTWENSQFNNGHSPPVDNTPRKPPDKDCQECHGGGYLYSPGSGKKTPCYCTKIKESPHENNLETINT